MGLPFDRVEGRRPRATVGGDRIFHGTRCLWHRIGKVLSGSWYSEEI